MSRPGEIGKPTPCAKGRQGASTAADVADSQGSLDGAKGRTGRRPAQPTTRFYRSIKAYKSQRHALQNVLRCSKFTEDELVRCRESKEQWEFIFEGVKKSPRGARKRYLDFPEDPYKELCKDLITGALRVALRLRDAPWLAEYQSAITFLLDDTSPYHRYLAHETGGLDRDFMEWMLDKAFETGKMPAALGRSAGA